MKKPTLTKTKGIYNRRDKLQFVSTEFVSTKEKFRNKYRI